MDETEKLKEIKKIIGEKEKTDKAIRTDYYIFGKFLIMSKLKFTSDKKIK